MKRNLTAKQLLIDAASFVDKKYNNQRQIIEFAENIDYNEFELALDALIELSDEVEEPFEFGFWTNLEQAALIMKLVDHEKIIKQKIFDFAYKNAENFKLKNPEIEATIYYLTAAEGGRSTLIFSGYRGAFIHDGQYNSATQEFLGQSICEPGETVKTLISFGAPEAQIGRLYTGLKFKITEGEKIIGIGEITKIKRVDFLRL